MYISRRNFLAESGFISAGFMGLAQFLQSSVCAEQAYQCEVDKYGKLFKDSSRILDLPKGFT